MIELHKIGRDFQSGHTILRAVDQISLTIAQNEFAAITGPSGSGKSTLLSLLAGLDRPTRGSIIIDGEDIGEMSETQLSKFRGKKIGFVFQNFQLIPTMTALENIKIPAEIQGDFKTAKRAIELLEKVHLKDRAHHYPHQLSGGEMQRVAIARASICKPAIILADEPTGNLDSKMGNLVIKLLKQANRYAVLVLITHNTDLAKEADREICLRDGKVHRIIKHKKNY